MRELAEILKAMAEKGYEYFCESTSGQVFRDTTNRCLIKFNSWESVERFLGKESKK